MKYFKRASKKPLGELLIEQGIITRDHLTAAMMHQKEHQGLLGEILVELKLATEKDIAKALTCQYGFPYLPLANYEIDAETLEAIPENLCRQFCLIPIDKIGKSLTVAMANPLNAQAAEDIELLTGCTVQMFVSTSSDIIESINKYYKS